jgi:hypothetical protein
MILGIPDKCPSVYEDHDRQITLPTNKCCSKILQALSTGTYIENIQAEESFFVKILVFL